MYPPPTSQHLSAEQARELDDTFLASDPFEYFRSRIAALLSWDETAPRDSDESPTAPEGSLRAQFNGYLQRAAADDLFSTLDIDAQIAADALAVRHHAAEALLRLACARLAPGSSEPAPCLWAEIADGPRQIVAVLEELREVAAAADAGERFLHAVVPPHERASIRAGEAGISAVNVFAGWLEYASQLLAPDQQIDLHGAHNKAKHGLAVRARADIRMTFTTMPPNEDGTVPLAALTGPDAIDIFDQPVLELLARGPKVDGHRQGLELTQLRLNSAAILADALMLAMTHGAMFHVAAVEHFDDREDLPDYARPPKFPGYPVGGPAPKDIDAEEILGMRYLLTTPPGGGRPARKSGMGFRDRFQSMTISHTGRFTGLVVGD